MFSGPLPWAGAWAAQILGHTPFLEAGRNRLDILIFERIDSILGNCILTSQQFECVLGSKTCQIDI